MKRLMLLLSLIACMGVSAQAATLTYQETGTNPNFLVITATEGTEQIWEMKINLGRADNHDYWRPGEIASFKDLQHGGTSFEYAQEAFVTSGTGMMRLTEMVGTFSDAGGRNADYYQFTVTRTLATVNTDGVDSFVTGTLTYRINAPVVASGGYTTAISANYVVNNGTPTGYNVSSAGSLGAQYFSMALNDAGFFDWAFINPIDAAVKPIVHNTDTVDGHQLYYIEDWYGSTVGGNEVGPLIKMVVKDNDQTQNLNMRPGLTFQITSPNMYLGYYALSSAARGSTKVSDTGGVNGSIPNGLRNAWNLATLPAGESRTMLYEGSIIAPGDVNVVSAAESTVTATSPVYADGTQQTPIVITLKNASGLPMAGIPAAEIVVAATGTGNTLVQPAADTDSNGQTVAYLASTVAETKTISVTAQGTLLDAQPTVQFLSTAIILEYSGSDIAAGDGTMTITARDIAQNKVLWTTTLVRTGSNVKISGFTDGGTFNYSGPAGNGKGMLTIGDTDLSGFNGSFSQISKTAAAYQFQVVTTGTVYEHTTIMTIQAPDAEGTVWPISRTVKNISDVAATPVGGMGFQLCMNIDGYTAGAVSAELSGTSGMALRKHQQALTEIEFLYSVYENVDRNATGLDVAGDLAGKVVVNNNEFTQTLGMTAGREFQIVSDMIAYYPAGSIGDANVEQTATDYLQRLYIHANPREFMGSSRSDHVALDPQGSYTVNYAFMTNIASSQSGPEIQPIGVTAAISPDFVYQTTPISTGDRHFATLTLTLDDPNGNTAYNITVSQTGGTGALYQVRDTANPLVKQLIGSRRTDGAANTGPVELLVTVEGADIGGNGQATTSVTVRRLGDIDGNGFVEPTDKGLLNSKLNGVVVPGALQAFDIDGNGFAEPTDKGLLNSILNGLAIQ